MSDRVEPVAALRVVEMSLARILSVIVSLMVCGGEKSQSNVIPSLSVHWNGESVRQPSMWKISRIRPTTPYAVEWVAMSLRIFQIRSYRVQRAGSLLKHLLRSDIAASMHAVSGWIRSKGVQRANITGFDRSWYAVPHQTLRTAVSIRRNRSVVTGWRYDDQVSALMAPAAMNFSAL